MSLYILCTVEIVQDETDGGLKSVFILKQRLIMKFPNRNYHTLTKIHYWMTQDIKLKVLVHIIVNNIRDILNDITLYILLTATK